MGDFLSCDKCSTIETEIDVNLKKVSQYISTLLMINTITGSGIFFSSILVCMVAGSLKYTAKTIIYFTVCIIYASLQLRSIDDFVTFVNLPINVFVRIYTYVLIYF